MSSTGSRYRLLVFLSGVAAACAVAPPVAVLSGVALGSPEVATTAVVGSLAVLACVAGAAATLSPDRPESVGVGGAPVVLVGLPATYGAVAVATLTTGESPALAVPMAAGSVVGTAAGLAAVGVAGSLRAARARTESECVVEFRARLADRPSWWVRALGVAGGSAVIAVGVVLALRGAGAEVWSPVVGFGGVGVPLVVRTGRARTFAVTDAGLVQGVRVHPWGSFEGYAATDDAVVLHRSGLRGDLRIDRGDLADGTAVRSALDRHLAE